MNDGQPRRGKRGNGNIRLCGTGWLITVYTGKKTKDGKPERQYKTVRGTRTEAQRELRKILTSLDNGTFVSPTRHTVEQLLQEWLEGYAKTNCSLRTHDGYESIINRHLIPALGNVKLKDLDSATVQRFYGKALQKVNERTHRNLSNRTVLRMHRVLSQALRWGVRQNYIWRNPADVAFVDPPKAKRYTPNTLSQLEAEMLLKAAEENRYYPVIYAAVNTGLRRNELLGLRWRDIDDLNMTISVNFCLYKSHGKVELKEPKTEHSRRRVSMTPHLSCFLREYREERESLYLRNGRILNLDDLVFADDAGQPTDPSVLSHNFGKICKRAGLNVRFHDLRHTCASLMLANDVHPKIVSEMLGHSTVSITLDVYSHVTPGLQKAAAERLGSVLPAGVVKRVVSGKLP